MADITAEVRVTVHAHDRPASFVDHEEIAVLPAGDREVVLFLSPLDAERWLQQLREAVEASMSEALGKTCDGSNRHEEE